ncbi:MAG: hypothetical protein JSR21_08400 [Proteobacteria bacterium]|nr:hypothetical protein [Pseudomonadota bacterium]
MRGAEVAAAALALSAAPAFLLMAVIARAPAPGVCGGMPGGTWGGMAPMYLLMAAVHAGAWLRLASGRGGGRC